MPATRSGKTDFKVGHEHQGRYVSVSGAFSATYKKRKAERPATRLRANSQQEEFQKIIKIRNTTRVIEDDVQT
jgi:hypothetical protein